MQITKDMRVKQIKPIPSAGILAGEDTIFVVTDMDDMAVFFRIEGTTGKYGTCGIGRDMFLEYFEPIPVLVKPQVIEDEPVMPEVIEMKKGDMVEITDGIFKGVKCSVEKPMTSVEGKVMLRTEDGNMLYIDAELLVVVEQKIQNETIETVVTWKEDFPIRIKIRNRRTTVKLVGRGVEGSVYCHENDTYDKNAGIGKAFNKAIVKLLEKNIVG